MNFRVNPHPLAFLNAVHEPLTGKESFRGPGSFNWDMALVERFPARGERISVLFRAEHCDVFNRASFNDPGISIAGSGFGQTLAAQDPRIGQLSLKLLF